MPEDMRTLYDPYDVAIAFEAWCRNFEGLAAGFDHESCSAVTTEMVEAYPLDGNLAKRPGAVCRRMQICDPAAPCVVPANVSGGGPQPEVLDTCSATGLADGPPVRRNDVWQPGWCDGDADCAPVNTSRAGLVCDRRAAYPACTCRDGVDECETHSRCASFCELPPQLARMRAHNTVPLCNTTADCAPGLVCGPLPAGCSVLTCAASGLSLALEDCPAAGACAMPPESLRSAALAPNLRHISVALNAAARPGSFPCSSLFANPTAAALGGAAARCKVEAATLTVHLPAMATVVPGDALVLADGQSALVLAEGGAPFKGRVNLQHCSPDCALPVAVLAAPPVITKPCPGANGTGAAFSVALDAGSSFDPSGRALADVSWRLAAGSAWDPVLQALMAAANTGPTMPMRLEVAAADLEAIAAGRYTVEVAAAGSAPVISLIGPADRHYHIGGGLTISTHLVLYDWTAADGETGEPWAAVARGPSASRKTLVIPAPVPARHGQWHVVTLTASVSASEAAGGADNVGLLSFTWSCSRDDGAPCFAANAEAACRSTINGSAWTVQPGCLTTDKSHTFGVTASLGGGDPAHTASASLSGVRPRPGNVPVGTLSRTCAAAAAAAAGSAAAAPAACPRWHPGDQPLTLVLQLPPEFEDATVAWSRADGAAVPASAVAPSGRQLTLPAAQLPRGGALTVTASASLGGGTGLVSATVQVEAPPYCAAPNGACLSVVAVRAAFPDAAFDAFASGFVDGDDDDDGALGGLGDVTYEWGVVGADGARLPLLVGAASPSFRFAGLPPGASTLYVLARDDSGAFAEARAAVEVAAPAGGFDAVAAVSGVDADRAADLGDPDAINAAAATLAALAAYCAEADCSAGGGGGGGGGGDNATAPAARAGQAAAAAAARPPPPAPRVPSAARAAVLRRASQRELQVAIDSKGAALLAASAAALNARDAAALQASAATAAGVVRAMGAVSEGAAAAAATIATALLAAHENTGTALDPASATAAIALLSAAAAAGNTGADPARGPSAADAARVARLLARGAQPGQGYLAAGDGGLYVAAANQPGLALPGLSIRLGVPSLEAALAFSGPFAGPCAFALDNGGRRLALCGAGVATVTARYHEARGSDAAAFIASGSLELEAGGRSSGGDAPGSGGSAAAGSGPSPVAASGALVVSVSGGDAETGGLPCQRPGACTISLSLPLATGGSGRRRGARRRRGRRSLQQLLPAPQLEGATLVCARVASTAAAGAVSEAGGFWLSGAANGTATCTVARSGAYVVLAFPRAAAGGAGDASVADAGGASPPPGDAGPPIVGPIPPAGALLSPGARAGVGVAVAVAVAALCGGWAGLAWRRGWRPRWLRLAPSAGAAGVERSAAASVAVEATGEPAGLGCGAMQAQALPPAATATPRETATAALQQATAGTTPEAAAPLANPGPQVAEAKAGVAAAPASDAGGEPTAAAVTPAAAAASTAEHHSQQPPPPQLPAPCVPEPARVQP
ncbi:hypothetical protein Rsub_00887 [Raphidocelis subcapitata]|uniref:PKD/REJ-like domain-containing protein n=1 Tax=Raphidocelis subcapitata TaxID=307507 RepID=A0A2V0NTL4_9CHLO|nr:hypothetical protein Rsub_00887 [Raphidocelis subcapitata]|eukprot:GBF88175.1 hypothetical protein Rsub_00887 [Raphidocelis subcapitata]